jgi:nucleotidyltransferase substrate binding protein (TIGR01987 family)
MSHIADKGGMAPDLTPLHNAIASLDRALKRSREEPADEEVRDSVIQRFEYTYDLSHKMLRRVLETSEANTEEIAQMSFPTLIRTGWERGLVRGSWPAWERFRKLRNTTSHTYDKALAIATAAQVPEFFDEAVELARRLAERLAS